MLGFTIISKKRLQQLEKLQFEVQSKQCAYNRLKADYNSLLKKIPARAADGKFTKNS